MPSEFTLSIQHRNGRIDTRRAVCHDDCPMDWNTFKTVNPRPAAAVILVRGETDFEVLLVRRNDRLQFMPGHHAFPGGGIAPGDDPALVSGPGTATERKALFAAVREAFEETGLLLARGALPPRETLRDARRALHAGSVSMPELLQRFGLTIHAEDFAPAGIWITPGFSPLRFHTHYFLHRYGGPLYQEVLDPDGEIVALDWMRPAEARQRGHEGAIFLSTPVAYVLRHLANASLEEALPKLADTPGNAALPSCFEPRIGIHIIPLKTDTLPPATHTNCVAIGESELLIVDPGAGDPEEQRRLLQFIERLNELGGKVSGILLTHAHSDHVSAAPLLRDRYNAPIACHAGAAGRLPFAVDRILEHGEILPVAGKPEWRVKCLHTPGHDPGHLCFLEETTGTLICGDMAANPGTILVSADDGGDMTAYLDSLRMLLEQPFSFVVPAHGLPTFRTNGRELFEQLLEHRLAREEKIRAAHAAGAHTIEELLARAYDDTPQAAWPFAAQQLRAHLRRLRITIGETTQRSEP